MKSVRLFLALPRAFLCEAARTNFGDLLSAGSGQPKPTLIPTEIQRLSRIDLKPKVAATHQH